MNLTEREGALFIEPATLEAPEGTVLAFTTRVGGVSLPPHDTLNLSYEAGDDAELVRENWTRTRRSLGLADMAIRELSQVHGIEAFHLTSLEQGHLHHGGDARQLGQADALVTALPGVPCALRYADCVPIALYSRKSKAMGLVHAGWRGTATGAVASAVMAMAIAFGATPGELQAFIFPHIHKCCFLVREDALKEFSRSFPGPSEVIEQASEAQWTIDLEAANRHWLTELGVTRIETSDLCTCCRDDLFFSYRRDGMRGCMRLIGQLV